MTLKALLFKFLAAVHPASVHMADVSKITDAIVVVTTEDNYVPVFGSAEVDAYLFSFTAWAESNMRLHAVGDHGTAFGAYQLHMEAGKGSALVQTRALVQHLRWDIAACPELPMAAFLSGNCLHARQIARRRMWAVMVALVQAGLTGGSEAFSSMAEPIGSPAVELVRFPHGSESRSRRYRAGRSGGLSPAWGRAGVGDRGWCRIGARHDQQEGPTGELDRRWSDPFRWD